MIRGRLPDLRFDQHNKGPECLAEMEESAGSKKLCAVCGNRKKNVDGDYNKGLV